MAPTRELREDLLQELLANRAFSHPESLLWLGAATDLEAKCNTWDEVLARGLEKREHQAREALAECKNKKKHWTP